MAVTKQDKKNAYLYCKFRDEQFAHYEAYARSCGMSVNMLFIINAIYYAKDGITQHDICEITHLSKQTVNLNIKALLSEKSVTVKEIPTNKRLKTVTMTAKGKEKYKEIVTHITNSEDKAMSMLTADEQEMLIALSRKFTEELIKLIGEV